MIKIYIKSYVSSHCYYYNLMLDNDSINWNLYTYKIRDVYHRIIGDSMDEYDPHILKYEKLEAEYELSASFCILANRAYKQKLFEVGNPEDCIYPFKDCLLSFLEKKIRLRQTPLTDKLREECTLNELTTWQHSKQYGRIGNNYIAYKTYLSINLYKYSQFIDYLISQEAISLNTHIPIVNGCYIFKESSNDAYSKFCHYTISLFNGDIFPIDIALQGQNYPLLKKILKEGGVKYTQDKRTCGETTWGDIICFIFKSAESSEDIELAKSFMFGEKDKAESLFKIKKDSSYDGYSWREYLEDDEKRILLAWYAALVYVGDVKGLQNLTETYPKQLFCILEGRNLYNTKILGYDLEDKACIPSEEMCRYIKNNITPYIGKFKFESKSYKDYGIWGFDARTGRPIKDNF